MRKVILVMLLTFVSASASAAWVKVSVSDAGDTYVEPATIRRAGDKVTMSELMDYKIVVDPNLSYKSAKRQYEFDCKEKRVRTLSTSAYSGRMGQGALVNSADNPSAEWVSVVTGSVGEILWKVACARRSKSI